MLKAQRSILSFWKDIEIFTLPDMPSFGIKELDLDKTLPWDTPSVPEKNSTWRHTIFFGKHAKEKIIDIIDKVISNTDEKPDWLDKPTGNTCMAIMVLNEQGQLAGDNSYLQASYLHGIKCLQEKRSLAEVNEDLEQVQEAFKERHPYNQEVDSLEDISSPIITKTHLKKEIAVLNELNITGVVCNGSIYVHSIKVSKLSKGDTAFLNSFYLDDINRLINIKEPLGKGLDDYLRIDLNREACIDLLTDANAFLQTIDPALIPAGRWPSDPSQGLYTAQIGAVNTSLKVLNKCGIIGVNGPPGTGKTTLLADIVADVIVMRTKKLMKKDVSGLFGAYQKIERESNTAYHYPADADVFNDAGIVVASNNNAAVENISKELPDERKIHRASFPDAGYFADHAQNLVDGKSWGLLAAALGNSDNRSFFKNNFWYKNGDEQVFSIFLQALYNNPEKQDHTVEYIELYRKTTTELESLLKEFDQFKDFAVGFYQLLPVFLSDQKLKVSVEHNIALLTDWINNLDNNRLPLMQDLSVQEKRISEIQYSIDLHNSIKPIFLFIQKLFNTQTFKNWNEAFLDLYNEYTDLSAKRTGLQKELTDIETKIKSKEKEKNYLYEELKKISQRLTNYNRKKKDLHELYAIAYENIPDENLLMAFSTDKDKFHKSNPWSSVKINKLSSNIFLKSLQLHEYAILKNAKQFKNNIGLLMELIDGKAVVAPDIALSLWRSFFFCIPVVSTSLASVSRLFGSLGKESIGWLLLDEAGQATPQSAAGIIYKTKRSIIIGDPLQIEPVVTIPGKLISILNAQYKNDAIWSPLRSSAQILADRVTTTGTWMKQGNEEDVWTGFPLRTHRRCNNPMFSIANQIAYSGQMVKAINDVPFNCVLGDSTWFDIDGVNVKDNHVVEEEIILLKEKVQLLGKNKEQVFVISPFKSIAKRCEKEFSHDPEIQCGTIHTFQGKEADIVFLVLGSNPSEPGSRQWVSQKPNKLNVALTRAKKRFYVIGSKKCWKGYNYFSVLVKAL